MPFTLKREDIQSMGGRYKLEKQAPARPAPAAPPPPPAPPAPVVVNMEPIKYLLVQQVEQTAELKKISAALTTTKPHTVWTAKVVARDGNGNIEQLVLTPR